MTKLATNVAHALIKTSAAICLLIIPFGVGYIHDSGAAEVDKKRALSLILLDTVPALFSLIFLLRPYEQKLQTLNQYLRKHPFIAMLFILNVPYVLGAMSKFYSRK